MKGESTLRGGRANAHNEVFMYYPEQLLLLRGFPHSLSSEGNSAVCQQMSEGQECSKQPPWFRHTLTNGSLHLGAVWKS